MNCPICNYPMQHITDSQSGLVCQNDNCGDEQEWCHDCDKPKTNCYCDLYEKETDEHENK